VSVIWKNKDKLDKHFNNFSSRKANFVKKIYPTATLQYCCSQCPKTCEQRADLQNHLKVHADEKPCSCSECLKSFALSGFLQRQLLVHKGGKVISCSHCSKSFAQSGDWQLHLRGHTGEKSSSCLACLKSSVRSDKLQLHMNRHLQAALWNRNYFLRFWFRF
jgi:uncharacterized Zn-finger protein